MGRLSDPNWKSGPTYQDPTASEHAIHPEDFGHDSADWDGFGVDEAEVVDGDPLVALQESVECHRDGCDAAHKRRLLFTTKPLSDDEKRALDLVSGAEEPGAYVCGHGERVGPESIEVALPEETPQSADSETRRKVDGIQLTAECIIEDEPGGACYGHVEPDPEPQWRDV